MSQYRRRNRTVLAKIETTSGTDASPALSDAVLMENPTSVADLQNIDTTESSSSLDMLASIPAGGSRSFTGRAYLKGAGVAGNAVNFDAFLRACTMGAKTLASNETGTVAAATATTVTLAAGASALYQHYRAMMMEITSGPGVGQRRMITSYDGATKIATVRPAWVTTPTATSSGYTIYACRRYHSQSVLLETATIGLHENRGDAGLSKLHKLLGAAGSFVMPLAVGAAPYIDFTMKGTLTSPVDVANPGIPVLPTVRPVPFQNASVYLGTGATSSLIKLNAFNLDLGATVSMEKDPGQEYGMDLAGVVDRRIAGTMSFPKELQSVRDAFAAWKASTLYDLAIWWGQIAGNRVAVLVPNLVFSGVTEEDVDGWSYEGVPWRSSVPDEGFYITFW